MQTKYHRLITRSCFEDWFSETALLEIITANITQDRVSYQFGHDYIHFDGSAFKAGFQYIDEQFQVLYENIENANYREARAALGHISHSWQDFYSHSNYVLLWTKKNNALGPKDIVPDDEGIMGLTDLISGKNYGLIEFFALLPALKRLILPLMPDDSHAKMNLDSPKSGRLFSYTYHAAVKRTQMILNKVQTALVIDEIGVSKINQFRGYASIEERYNQTYE